MKSVIKKALATLTILAVCMALPVNDVAAKSKKFGNAIAYVDTVAEAEAAPEAVVVTDSINEVEVAFEKAAEKIAEKFEEKYGNAEANYNDDYDEEGNIGLSLTGMLAIICCIGLPIICVFILFLHIIKSRKEQNDKLHETLLKLAESGQAITPELIDSLRKGVGSNQGDVVMNDDMAKANMKLAKGGALIVIALVLGVAFQSTWPIIIAVVGIFALAQGIAQYINGKRQGRNGNNDNQQTPPPYPPFQ